jgi:uroporphyrinogen decarboxylase
MASYMIEGGPSAFLRTKQMMYRDETLWRRLMGKLVDVLGRLRNLQVAAGARIIQVFDSWVGAHWGPTITFASWRPIRAR